MSTDTYLLRPIGVVVSTLTDPKAAPNQGNEGAPEAWLEILEDLAPGLDRLTAGDEILVLTWLHLSHRDELQTHPRGDLTAPLTGVFATRSPNRPNPIGLHRVTVLDIQGTRVKVAPLEAIDGTPIVDIKPVLRSSEG